MLEGRKCQRCPHRASTKRLRLVSAFRLDQPDGRVRQSFRQLPYELPLSCVTHQNGTELLLTIPLDLAKVKGRVDIADLTFLFI